MKEFKDLTSKNSALEYQLLEIQKSNMQGKLNMDTQRDSPRFKNYHIPSVSKICYASLRASKPVARWISNSQGRRQQGAESGLTCYLTTRYSSTVLPRPCVCVDVGVVYSPECCIQQRTRSALPFSRPGFTYCPDKGQVKPCSAFGHLYGHLHTCMDFGVNVGHAHQHHPLLLQSEGPRPVCQ